MSHGQKRAAKLRRRKARQKIPAGKLIKYLKDLGEFVSGGFQQIGQDLGMVMDIQAAIIEASGPDFDGKVKEIVKARIAKREAEAKAEHEKTVAAELAKAQEATKAREVSAHDLVTAQDGQAHYVELEQEVPSSD